MPVAPRGDFNRRSTGSGLVRPAGSPTGGSMPAQAGQPQQQQRLTPQQQAMMMQQMYMQQQQRYAQRNAGQPVYTQRPRRDRMAGVITDEEWAEGVEDHADTGKGFRRMLLIVVLAAIALLAYCKYDIEYSMDLPPELLKLAERDAELRGEAVTSEGKTVPVVETPENAEQLEEFYRTLNVDAPDAQALSPEEIKKAAQEELARRKAEAKSAEERAKLEGEDALLAAMREEDRLRRLDKYRKMKETERNFNQHLEERGQLVACGRECEAQHKQMQMAYDTLRSQVDRELFGVLLDKNVAKDGSAGSVDPEELKAAFERKKEQIEKTVEDEEVKNMELAEIKDAYDILQNPDTRAYYQLTGRKPPEHMRKTSTKHGGWGQELLLRTHKNRLVLAWLDYFNAAWADYAVLGVIGFFGFVLPVAVQFPRILEMAREIEERQIQMEELEKKMAAEGAAPQ